MRRFLAMPVALAAAVSLAACDVEWGGAQIALEDPAPEEIVEETPDEEVIVPLPPGPLLYRVEVEEDGSALVVPVARMSDSVPVDMEFPEEFDDTFRARFDSAFLAPGTELGLFSDGHRIGSVLLTDQSTTWLPTCPSASPATTLLASGQSLPVSGFALQMGLIVSTPGVSNPIEPDRRMRTFGPVLTENILEQRGYDRAYLAQRATMSTVTYGDDPGPALVATYLVNDSLTVQASDANAVSLFFLARYEPARGYYPVWHEYRRYRSAEDREVFAYADWFAVAAGRLDFLELYGHGSVRLAASLEREDSRKREIDWIESERCQSRVAFNGAPPPAAPSQTPAGGQEQAPAGQTPARTPGGQQAGGQAADGQPGAGQPAAADTGQSRRRQTEPDIQPRPPVQVQDTASAGQ